MTGNVSAMRQRAERLSPEKRRAAILGAARTLIREHGYEAIGMADIAAAVGVVEGTLYRYFDNKGDVMLAVISDWYEAALADYDEKLRGFDHPRQQLRYMVWRHLDLIHRDPDLAHLVFVHIRPRADYRATVVYRLNRAYVDHIRTIHQEAVACGELRGDVPFAIVRDMLFGAVEHHAFPYLRGERDFAPGEVADAIVDIVYNGLRSAVPSAAMGDAVKRLSAIADRMEGSLAAIAAPIEDNA